MTLEVTLTKCESSTTPHYNTQLKFNMCIQTRTEGHKGPRVQGVQCQHRTEILMSGVRSHRKSFRDIRRQEAY